jgi:acetyl esterase
VPDLDLLDASLKTIIDQLAAMGGAPLSEMSPADARETYKLLAAADGPPEEVGAVTDRDVAGVPCRVYRPMTGGADLPVLAWFHGGGWVIGDLDTADGTCRRLANQAGCVVVSVDYRRAPESPFPAAVDDCWAVTSWLTGGGAAELGGDPARISVGGDSAGGNLAAVVALLARDAGTTLRHQLLVYPVTDLSTESPSYAENGEGFLLTSDTMRWFVGHYTAPEDRSDWRASPLLAEDVQGVAPAHVITAGFDPLRDEGDAYALRLANAGVPVEHHRVAGGIHGFFGMRAVSPLAADTVDRAAEILARATVLDRA